MPEPCNLDRWLARLSAELDGLPPLERAEIVFETRCLVEEMVARGKSWSRVLAEFGSPADYATRFDQDPHGTGRRDASLQSERPTLDTPRLAANLSPLLALIPVTMILTALAAVKVWDPVHAGVWVGPRGSLIGVIDDTQGCRELLGMWLFPITAAMLATTWAVGRSSLGHLLRTRSDVAVDPSRRLEEWRR